MDESDLRIVESFLCPQCGASCAVSHAGDLLIAACPHEGTRFVLTVAAPDEAPAGEAQDPLVGATLGPCRVARPAGFEGGLPLYHGLDVALNLPHAIRVLSGGAARDAKQVQAFVRAGKLAAAVRRAAFANVTQLGQFTDGFYAISTALEGQPFERALGGAGRLGLREALFLGRHLAEALAALHHARIVHRNVGPKSLFILPKGELMLRNFAFAAGPDSPPEPQAVVGQPGYLAPEQLAGGEVDARADLYSLGALLYLALVGRPAFGGSNPTEILRAQAAGPVRAREALAATAPPEVAGLVLRLLAEAPEDRPASAHAVAAALAELRPKTERVPRPLAPAPAPAPAATPPPGFDEAQLAIVEPEAAPPPPPPAPAPPAKEPVPPPASAPQASWLELTPDRPPRPQPLPEDKGTEALFSPDAEAPADSDVARRAAPAHRPAPARPPQPPRRAPAPPQAPTPARPPEGAESDFLLESDREPEEGEGGDVEELEEAPASLLGRLKGQRPAVLVGVAVAVLAVGIVAWLTLGSSPPPPAPPAAVKKAPAKHKKELTPAQEAEAAAAAELRKLDALAKAKDADPDAVAAAARKFLAAHGKTPSAAAAKAILDAAVAAKREKDAKAEARPVLADLKAGQKPTPQLLAEAQAYLGKHAGTKAAATVQTAHDQLLARLESEAGRAAPKALKDAEAHVQAEAYGEAIAGLAALFPAFEGTKAAAPAAARLAELRKTVAEKFAELKTNAEKLAAQSAFGEAIAQFDGPLSRWHADGLKQEAEALVAPLRERRAAVVKAYGEALGEFDRLVGEWKFEDAAAQARAAAAKAGDAVLRALLEGKAGDAELLLGALDRIVAGAKAEQARAAKGDGRVWLQRNSGVRLKSTIDKPSRQGLEVDMPGLKGFVSWAEMSFGQLTAFADAVPAKGTAAEHAGLCLLALHEGDSKVAIEEFDKALALDPAALELVRAGLARHIQCTICIPAGQFLAGQNKQPATLDGFLLGAAEVTNADYAMFLRAPESTAPTHWEMGKYPAGHDDWPVTGLTWAQADAYARWLGMRLPTALEWERAVRGTDGRLYPWGDTLDPAMAHIARTAPRGKTVELLPANRHVNRRDDTPFFHLVGNAREWTSTPHADRRGANVARVVVGGSAVDPAKDGMGYARSSQAMDTRDLYTGFRLAWPR